jgi:hypothetical protein
VGKSNIFYYLKEKILFVNWNSQYMNNYNINNDDDNNNKIIIIIK